MRQPQGEQQKQQQQQKSERVDVCQQQQQRQQQRASCFVFLGAERKMCLPLMRQVQSQQQQLSALQQQWHKAGAAAIPA
jgi:hypothetical protein